MRLARRNSLPIFLNLPARAEFYRNLLVVRQGHWFGYVGANKHSNINAATDEHGSTRIETGPSALARARGWHFYPPSCGKTPPGKALKQCNTGSQPMIAAGPIHKGKSVSIRVHPWLIAFAARENLADQRAQPEPIHLTHH